MCLAAQFRGRIVMSSWATAIAAAAASRPTIREKTVCSAIAVRVALPGGRGEDATCIHIALRRD